MAIILVLFGLLSSAAPQQRAGRIVLIIPFENMSKSPGIEWIGEAFSEVLGQRLAAQQFFVIRREDRVYAFNRLALPVNIRPSRATLYRVAEEMDVDYVVVGNFTFDGRTFTARSQLLDMKRVRLSPESVESGSLPQLADIQNATAWDLLKEIDPTLALSKTDYLNRSTAVRLDALENYIRGMLSNDGTGKIKFLKEAARLSPDYTIAILQLGRAYFDNKEYDQAATWLSRVPRSDSGASEANFYLGMADYYTGNFDKAEQAFTFVSTHVPLIEVYNNLGVVTARRGKQDASAFFERVVQADSRDEDYRFNLAVALARRGDTAGSLKQLKEALNIKPQDSEAKTLFDALSQSKSAASPVKLPLERIKRNYDETSYRQLAMEIQNATEGRHASLSPAEHATVHLQRGQEFMRQGSFDQAESEFRESILLDQSNADAHAGLANALQEQDELTEARAEAMAANRIHFTPGAFLTLARIEMKQNKLDSARDAVDRALRLDANSADAAALKKKIAEKMGQQSKSQ